MGRAYELLPHLPQRCPRRQSCLRRRCRAKRPAALALPAILLRSTTPGSGCRYDALIATMPDPFLELVVHDVDVDPSLTALCVCYELGQWRAAAFARHLFEWLPEFALTWSERQRFSDSTSVALLRRAADVVYRSEKYQRRGEFGELILHAVIRQVFESEPAISKIFFKSASNDTVKGFDAVHIVPTRDGLELWLGEAKLYTEISGAINAVVAELQDHLEADYLRSEFSLIENKVDEDWPYAAQLKQLLSPNTSLDRVFKRVTVPVLLTYESPTLLGHREHTEDYASAFEAEVRQHWSSFRGKALPENVMIRLFLLPLQNKAALLEELDGLLRVWQNI